MSKAIQGRIDDALTILIQLSELRYILRYVHIASDTILSLCVLKIVLRSVSACQKTI